MYTLSDARYGKDNVRLYKVHRDEKTGVQTVYEMTVCVLLEGDINTSYTKEDNSVLVTTDAIKNTGKPHPHSFFQDGSVKRVVLVDVIENSGISITSSVSGLSVLKSTKSDDVDIKWQWRHFSNVQDVETNALHFQSGYEAARDATFDIFAEDNSMSAQGTLYKMAERFLESVEYSWPNKHYVEIDLSWHKGLQNTDKNAEVYLPQSAPNGLIKGTLTRSLLRETRKAKL
ncbi:uricase [Aspergillus ellipticus CBS 707.79]|uniref:Uricase n=1 Tax=Aspergillus ellipticus CBS 707.79 TaxID=1448320 RepID=A0A319EEA3_9EURO|nr:uricase [Aspergillus ellipticus CBS 707.79]